MSIALCCIWSHCTLSVLLMFAFTIVVQNASRIDSHICGITYMAKNPCDDMHLCGGSAALCC